MTDHHFFPVFVGSGEAVFVLMSHIMVELRHSTLPGATGHVATNTANHEGNMTHWLNFFRLMTATNSDLLH